MCIYQICSHKYIHTYAYPTQPYNSYSTHIYKHMQYMDTYIHSAFLYALFYHSIALCQLNRNERFFEKPITYISFKYAQKS